MLTDHDADACEAPSDYEHGEVQVVLDRCAEQDVSDRVEECGDVAGPLGFDSNSKV